MTADEVVERIIALRQITEQTGCITTRTQGNLLQSLPDDLLLEVSAKLAPILRQDKDRKQYANHRKTS